MLTVLLTALASVSAILHVRAEYRGALRETYIFKPLTMVFIILIAFLTDVRVTPVYKYLIIGGLCVSLLGDIFLMLPPRMFLPGLVSFLVAHLFYIAAFTLTGAGALPSVWLIPFLLYGCFMFWVLSGYLGKLRIPVASYMLVILLMGSQALSRWLRTDQAGSGSAALGALLFIASDSLLAVNRFKGKSRHAPLYVMSTYYSAQWFIAHSI